MEINIPPQQIYANCKGGLIIEGGVMWESRIEIVYVAVPDRNDIIPSHISSTSPSLMRYSTELLLRVGLICNV